MVVNLVYEGELKKQKSGIKAHKQYLRNEFNRQLTTLWETEPLKSKKVFAMGKDASDLQEKLVAALGKRERIPDENIVEQVGGEYFLPLISAKYYLSADIKITWVRHEEPGNLFEVGDIDNRLKTLFDALNIPQENQLPDGPIGSTEDEPFYTLLQDDSLISSVTVDTKRDLRQSANPKSVLLLIQVTTIVNSPNVYNTIYL